MIDKFIIGSQTIYKVNYNNNSEWHENDIQIATSKANKLNLGPLSTSNLADSNIPIFVKYRKFVYENIKKLYEGEFTVAEMWYSEYLHKSYINLHNHYRSNIVSVGYINVDEQDKSSCLVVQNNENYSLVDIPVSNGDILIFNGNLMHKSKPNMSNSIRKLVGLNYKKIMNNSPV
tara:strand:- start:41 stop:565 length:525 start_codon:yes stop_codon:yes gene_type:complete